jgi:hypothetical protein
MFAQCQQTSAINVPFPISYTCTVRRTTQHRKVAGSIQELQKQKFFSN